MGNLKTVPQLERQISQSQYRCRENQIALVSVYLSAILWTKAYF